MEGTYRGRGKKRPPERVTPRGLLFGPDPFVGPASCYGSLPLAFSYPSILKNTPAATADPMTPATLGPMAGMRGFTSPSVSWETNC